MNRNDKILIGVLLLLALSFTFIYRAFVREEGARVVITVDGREYESLSLNKDADLIIPGVNDSTNRLIIKNGEAKMTEATCPDKLCVHQRAIKYSGESIICLPNKVVVAITGSKEQDVDAVQ